VAPPTQPGRQALPESGPAPCSATGRGAVPYHQPGISQDQRWALAARLLHDTTLDPTDRRAPDCAPDCVIVVSEGGLEPFAYLLGGADPWLDVAGQKAMW
jgi:hypothetical protein